MPFTKGQGGRPKGARNKSAGEAQKLCLRLVSDPDYRKRIKQRLVTGGLPPGIEAMLWHYAYGKPIEQVEFGGMDGEPMTVQVIHKYVAAPPDAAAR